MHVMLGKVEGKDSGIAVGQGAWVQQYKRPRLHIGGPQCKRYTGSGGLGPNANGGHTNKRIDQRQLTQMV